MKVVVADPIITIDLMMLVYEHGVNPKELLLCCGAQGFQPFILVEEKVLERASAGEKGVCKKCGCTWNDPCVNASGEACAWANKEQTLCTFCAGKKK
ncbi:MAG: hypothetical protein WC478_05635 [Candidatus Omnitrophota bacterium]